MRVDLCTIHELLEKLGYGEEDGVASRTWYVNDFFVSKEMIITRNLRADVDADSHEYIMYICAYHFSYQKHGDAAFRAKDFDTAIEFFTEVKTQNHIKDGIIKKHKHTMKRRFILL